MKLTFVWEKAKNEDGNRSGKNEKHSGHKWAMDNVSGGGISSEKGERGNFHL